jgi:hypothetical protein
MCMYVHVWPFPSFFFFFCLLACRVATTRFPVRDRVYRYLAMPRTHPGREPARSFPPIQFPCSWHLSAWVFASDHRDRKAAHMYLTTIWVGVDRQFHRSSSSRQQCRPRLRAFRTGSRRWRNLLVAFHSRSSPFFLPGKVAHLQSNRK